MITIWYGTNNTCRVRARKIAKWLEQEGYQYKLKDIRGIKEEDIRKLISISDIGFDAIVKSSGKPFIENKRFSEAIQILLNNPKHLKEIITYDSDRNIFRTGYNKEETEHMFRSKETRERQKKMQAITVLKTIALDEYIEDIKRVDGKSKKGKPTRR